MVDPDRPWMAV